MGRFAEESHTDLREWYVHCLDFLVLKRRLVDDPPDPYDDHPLMVAGSSLRLAAENDAGSSDAASSGCVERKLGVTPSSLSAEQGQLLPDTERGVRLKPSGHAGSDVALAGASRDESGDISDGAAIFSDRASRVFAFEIKQELDRVWSFYQDEGRRCAAQLLCLQDTSASARHKLHRKLDGSGGGGGNTSSGGQDGKASGHGSSSSISSLSDSATPYAVGVSSGGCLRPTAQEQMMLGNASASSTQPRIRGRRTTSSSSTCHERTFASPPPMSSGGPITTEDPYVQASLKRSIVELYNTCHRLLSFKMLNYDASVRLVELHCRRLEAETVAAAASTFSKAVVTGISGHGTLVGAANDSASAGAALLSREKAMKMWLLEQPLFASRELNRTIAGAELLYASLFCNGDVDVARTALTFKSSTCLRGNRRFDFGYRLGLATVLLAWALWDCIMDDPAETDIWHDPAFKIFRGLGNLVLLVYMWGVNIWVWRRFGIDYERCLSLDPKGPRVDPCEQIWNAGCNLSIWFLVCFICFYKALRQAMGEYIGSEVAHIFPLILLIYVAFSFLMPWKERKGLLHVLWTVIISPWGQVRFLEGYVGDILTSTVKVLTDIAFAFTWVISPLFGPSSTPFTKLWWWKGLLVPVLTVAPLWWRFQQNLRRSYETGERWPHLGNALKYATAMSVSLFGLLQQKRMHGSVLWVFCYVYATLYQFTWDVVMDWDLLRWDGRTLRLRPRLLYRRKSVYVAVTVVNLALRFLWTETLIPEGSSFFPKNFHIYTSPLIAAAEIIRRTMWGFLRVENEHLRIYGDNGHPGSDTEDLAELACSVDGVGAADCSTGGAVGKSNDGVTGAGGSRGNGLDRLPYARMEISTASSSANGLLPRSQMALKAWCLNKVQPDSRRRLLLELCVFAAALVTVGFVAGASGSTGDTIREHTDGLAPSIDHP